MILKLNVGQTVSCEKDGKWLKARCLRVDCSLVKILFESDNTTEWIYRGSTRYFYAQGKIIYNCLAIQGKV